MVTTIAGRYELDPVHIGRGGMGEVWGATDTRLHRRVAVKFVRFPDDVPDPELTRRFVRESRLTARMCHPGVPVLHDADQVAEGPFAGRLYLVMELVDGIDLGDLVAEHDPLPIGWAASIAAQISAVLGYAHAHSLVHRDLKPSNVMLDQEGAVKVLDFGLAVALDADSRLTSSDQVLGTLAYMAPEQFRGRSEPSSDLYALGCVLYQMLCGHGPFDGSDRVSLMHAHIYEKPAAITDLRAGVPPDLADLVHRLLTKEPEARPASAAEVYDALLPHIDRLPDLPGAVRAGRSPTRMYARVVGRTHTPDPAPRPSPHAEAPPRRAPEPPDSFSLGDVARARRRAERLMRESRFDEAARTLGRTSARAESVLGAEHSEVAALRADLADVLFKGGDYTAAAAAFHALAADAARRDGPDAEPALRLRLQEANSHALAGDVGRALSQIERLITDATRVHGEDDSRVLDLRRQLGLLQHGAGRTASAVRTLEALADDLRRLHGPDDRALRTVRETLDRMR